MNRLYFGDCLDVLKELNKEKSDGFIDLVYTDPPFNSKRNYNVLFESVDLEDTKAQKEAFSDTWSSVTYEDTLNEIKLTDLDLYSFLHTLDHIRLSKSAISYLTTMAIRILYIHKVIKETGSFYLHCDPAMSHYLKLVCDLIFGQQNFRSEIIWRRTNSHNKLSKQYGPIHDVILFYTKSDKFIFHPLTRPYTKAYIKDRFKNKDERGIYQTNYLTGPGKRTGDSGKEWRGFNPTNAGRHWAIPASLIEFLPEGHENMKSLEKLEELYKKDLVIFPKKEGGQPMYKQYIGNGTPYQDIWAYQPNTNGVLYNTQECIDEDVKYLENEAEILGYPTQKPIGLLERIINTSTNKGDLVADFFCGCGTAVDAAEKLKRKWIGADISHLATRLITKRLVETYGVEIRKTFELYGFPRDVASARVLSEKAEKGRFKFQEWVIEAELGGVCNPKKTADGGWDGHMTFDINGKRELILIEVKSGNVNVKNLREFIQVVDKQKAAIGLFVCFTEQVTKPMQHEAAQRGYFMADRFPNAYPKIQIITVDDLIDKKLPRIPAFLKTTFKSAERLNKEEYDPTAKQTELEI